MPSRVDALLPAERAAVDDLRRFVRERFQERVREMSLFGSLARGERHDGSDVDVLVVVEGLTSAERREVGAYSGDLMTRHDVLVAPFAVSAERWAELRARERLIALEIERDRVPL